MERPIAVLFLFFTAHSAALGANMSEKISNAESAYLKALQKGDMEQTLKRLDKLLNIQARTHGEWGNLHAVAVNKAGRGCD